MGTLLLRFQQLRNGLPSLNVAVPALKMIQVKDVQKVQKHQKSSNECTIWYWMTGLEDDPGEGRPKSAKTPEIIEQVHDMVLQVHDMVLQVHDMVLDDRP